MRADLVDQARGVAERLLAEVLPQRWAHTVGVADRAERLSAVLGPVQAETIVAAAWLHDIGYAPGLADTGFHPIDGASHVLRTCPELWSTVELIAHHSGAVFEARERGLGGELARYRFPVDIEELAILNAADLCTSPEGEPVDPQDRIGEVLDRYRPGSPVHQALLVSGPALIAQAHLVLGAAQTADYRQRCVTVPERVERVDAQSSSWRAVWCGGGGDDLRVVTATRPIGPAAGSGVVEIGFPWATPVNTWGSNDAAWLAADVAAATQAASGGQLNWHEYRGYELVGGDTAAQRRVELPIPASSDSGSTFHFDDVARLQLDMTARGRVLLIQQRTIATLGEVTEWQDVSAPFNAGPLDLRGSPQHPRGASRPGEQVSS